MAGNGYWHLPLTLALVMIGGCNSSTAPSTQPPYKLSLNPDPPAGGIHIRLNADDLKKVNQLTHADVGRLTLIFSPPTEVVRPAHGWDEAFPFYAGGRQNTVIFSSPIGTTSGASLIAFDQFPPDQAEQALDALQKNNFYFQPMARHLRGEIQIYYWIEIAPPPLSN